VNGTRQEEAGKIDMKMRRDIGRKKGQTDQPYYTLKTRTRPSLLLGQSLYRYRKVEKNEAGVGPALARAVMIKQVDGSRVFLLHVMVATASRKCRLLVVAHATRITAARWNKEHLRQHPKSGRRGHETT
jgi:hypothetical protein